MIRVEVDDNGRVIVRENDSVIWTSDFCEWKIKPDDGECRSIEVNCGHSDKFNLDFWPSGWRIPNVCPFCGRRIKKLKWKEFPKGQWEEWEIGKF